MDYIYVEGSKIIEETDKAFLVIMTRMEGEELDNWDMWIPKSVIANPEDYKIGDEDLSMCVAEWFAKKEGWMEDEVGKLNIKKEPEKKKSDKKKSVYKHIDAYTDEELMAEMLKREEERKAALEEERKSRELVVYCPRCMGAGTIPIQGEQIKCPCCSWISSNGRFITELVPDSEAPPLPPIEDKPQPQPVPQGAA